MDISPGPPFWRIIADDMDIPLLDHLSLSGRPDRDIHGAAVNFAFTEFSEVRTEYLRLASCTHRAQATSEGDTLYMSIFPTKILLATDGSREAKLASTTAADLAKGTSSELHVLYVGEAINPYAEEVGLAEAEAGDFERQARDLLEAEAERVRAAGGAVAQAHQSRCKVDQEVVTLAEEIGAGLIVLGSRGHGGIRRALMGSVSDAVVRHAH